MPEDIIIRFENVTKQYNSDPLYTRHHLRTGEGKVLHPTGSFGMRKDDYSPVNRRICPAYIRRNLFRRARNNQCPSGQASSEYHIPGLRTVSSSKRL